MLFRTHGLAVSDVYALKKSNEPFITGDLMGETTRTISLSKVKRFPLVSYVTLLLLFLLSAIACQPAHAIVWCHDYTAYSMTGGDADNTPPGTLRELLSNLGYRRFSYTSARFSPDAMSHLKPGDVMIIGDSHSGVVNANGTIDHFIQIEGRSGTHYNTWDPAFRKLVRKNNTLEQFLNRPIYRNMTLEVWRVNKRAELSAGSTLPLLGPDPWSSSDFHLNPKTGNFTGTFINRRINTEVGNKASLFVQGTLNTKQGRLKADFSGNTQLTARETDRRENRFSGTMNLNSSGSNKSIVLAGPASLTFSHSESGYETGRKYSGTVKLRLSDAGATGGIETASEQGDPPNTSSSTGYLRIFVITPEGQTIYKARIAISSGSARKEGETDYEGSVGFDLPPGTVSVTAQPPVEMKMKTVTKSISITPGATRRIYLVTRPEGEATGTEDYGRLTVRVMDEEGWFSGAKVVVEGTSIHNYVTGIEARTGADGYAAIMDPLPPGTYRVVAGASGHGIDAENITVLAGREASLVLLLPYKLQPLSVGVLDKATHKVISGARVELEPGVTTLTDVQGVAAFKGVPVGRRKGKVTAQGYRAAGFSVNVDENVDYLTSTAVYLEAGKTPEESGSPPAGSDRERRALQDDLRRWVKILECLEEGKRKYPSNWLDCNGNWTMRDRDVEIAHYRNLIKGARSKLGQRSPAPPPVSPSAQLPSDRVALTAINGTEAFGIVRGGNERRPSNGELMASGTTLRTGKQSTASFRTPGETRVTLQPNTRVTVVQKPSQRDTVWQVDVSAGAIDVVHREGAPGFDDVNVTSRNGSVTPFNTRYRVEVGPTGTLVEVFQGRVHLNGTQILRISTGGKPSPVTSLDLRAGERAMMLKTAGTADRPVAKNLLINGGFEQGLAKPWESGSFTRDGATWINNGSCRSTADVDSRNAHSGTASLHLRNASPRSPNVYGTMTQKVKVNRYRKYVISLWARGDRLASKGALNVAVDPMWRIRPLALPAGTFGWSRFSGTFNSQDRDVVDFRIIFEDTGDVWLDDLAVEELPANENTRR